MIKERKKKSIRFYADIFYLDDGIFFYFDDKRPNSQASPQSKEASQPNNRMNETNNRDTYTKKKHEQRQY